MDTLSFYSLAGRTRGFCRKVSLGSRQELVAPSAAGLSRCRGGRLRRLLSFALGSQELNGTSGAGKNGCQMALAKHGGPVIVKNKRTEIFLPNYFLHLSRNVDRPSAGVR